MIYAGLGAPDRGVTGHAAVHVSGGRALLSRGHLLASTSQLRLPAALRLERWAWRAKRAAGRDPAFPDGKMV